MLTIQELDIVPNLLSMVEESLLFANEPSTREKIQRLQIDLDHLINEISYSNDEIFAAQQLGNAPAINLQNWGRWLETFTDLLRTLAEIKGFQKELIENAGYRTLLNLMMIDSQLTKEAKAELQL